MSDNTKATIIKIIKEQLSLPIKRKIDSDTTWDDLGADFLDQLELILTFEEYFDIEISGEDAAKISTVGDLCLYIYKMTET